jgi:YD repeat-containing protein
MFGMQWSSTYEEQLSLGNDGTMKLARADGGTWSFTAISQGGSWPQPAVLQTVAPGNIQGGTLTESGSSSSVWTVTFLNGEQRVFSGLFGGPLASIIDRNGNTTSLTYDANGRLTTVTDPAGRHLNFAYGSSVSSNVVSSVTSDSGTSINVTYTYESGSQLSMNPLYSTYPFLVQVTQSDGTFTTFSYNYDGLITSVNDQAGKVLEAHTYGTSGCNAGLSSTRALGADALTISFADGQYCSYAGVGGP